MDLVCGSHHLCFLDQTGEQEGKRWSERRKKRERERERGHAGKRARVKAGYGKNIKHQPCEHCNKVTLLNKSSFS